MPLDLHVWFGWALPEKWVCLALMTPFSHPPCILKTSISAFFGSQDPIFTPKSQISRNLKLQSLKFSKEFSSKALKLTQEFSSHGYIFSSLGSWIRQWSIHKPLCSARSDCTPKWKLSAPAGLILQFIGKKCWKLYCLLQRTKYQYIKVIYNRF